MFKINNFLKETTIIFYDPLEQFEVINVFGHVLTNISVYMLLNILIFTLLIGFIINFGLYNVFDYIVTNVYFLVKSIWKSNTNLKRSQYFSNLFFLFNFILISNLIGLLPYSFTITSSFIVTFFLALTHFIGINIIAIFNHKWEISNLFLPSGTPLGISPILVLIELVSYIARVFSLSIRLFANMMSGHTLLKILIGFSWTLLNAGSIYFFIAFFPWIIVTIIMFLESLIAFLQAYVFVILITIYINDVLNLH